MAAPATPKVKAAAQGGGAAGALSVIIVWGASQAGLDVPAEVASAFTTLVASAAAFAAGYYKSNV